MALGRLQQASNVLFSRFVELRQHVEVELRETTNGDQGIVDCWQPLTRRAKVFGEAPLRRVWLSLVLVELQHMQAKVGEQNYRHAA